MSLEPSTSESEPRQRHALGLPAGSVRALLALGVLGLLWGLVFLYRDQKLPKEFIYLEMVMGLMVASFFTAHGKNIRADEDARSPLGMPPYTVRLLLLAGIGGLAYYMWHTQREFSLPDSGPVVLTLALLVTAFLLGHIWAWLVKLFSGGRPPAWFRDFEAWLALVALICLIIAAFIHLINPTVEESLRVDATGLHVVLAAIVGFYFGARS